MDHHTAAQLAQYRRQQLTAEATYQRHLQACRSRGNGPRSGPRRPLAAFHSWLATGQL